MNLTNILKPSSIFSDAAESFSKYVSQQDKYDLPLFERSFNSQTLLLQSTPIPQKKSFCLSSEKIHSFIIKKDKENIHLGDINEEFQICINGHLNEKIKNKATENIPLVELCEYLIQTIKDLQIKIENIQNKQNINKKLNFYSQVSQQNKNAVSFLNSTKQTEKQRIQKCQNCTKYKDFMQITVQNIENKTKASIYKQQMQKTQKQLMKLQALNEDNKREIQKLKGQNRKFKELIKQYQIFNKRNIQSDFQNFYTNNIGSSNNIDSKTFKSQFQKNKLQRENSLDQKLKENENLRRSQGQYKFYSPDAFRRIKSSQFFLKETPKTPQQLIFRKLRDNNQKTELKSKRRSCNGLLKQIIQFEQKKQRGIQNRENMFMDFAQSNNLVRNRIKNYNPKNEILHCQLQNNNSYLKNFMNLPNFQTMESMQDVIYKKQSKINVQQPNKKKSHIKFRS